MIVTICVPHAPTEAENYDQIVWWWPQSLKWVEVAQANYSIIGQSVTFVKIRVFESTFSQYWSQSLSFWKAEGSGGVASADNWDSTADIGRHSNSFI